MRLPTRQDGVENRDKVYTYFELEVEQCLPKVRATGRIPESDSSPVVSLENGERREG